MSVTVRSALSPVLLAGDEDCDVPGRVRLDRRLGSGSRRAHRHDGRAPGLDPGGPDAASDDTVCSMQSGGSAANEPAFRENASVPEIAIGKSLADSRIPLATKRGGVAGRGISGRVTYRASVIMRGMTGGARWTPLKNVAPTSSVGGSITRTLPGLGAY